MKKFPELNLPAAPLRIANEGETLRVFDTLRQKWVTLTPEEWVRQHFTSWMMKEFGYPASLMANEIGIEVNGTRKRCDTVVFASDGHPRIIIEYKAPDVAVTQGVFDQIVRYNMRLHADYLIVSNGLTHYCCRMDYKHDTYHFIPHVPTYASIVSGASEN